MMPLTVLEVRNFLASLFASDNSIIKSNAIDRNNPTSIGVFTAPESRMGKVETFGGLAPINTLPINILVRWTEDSDACETKANEIYKKLSEIGQNFPLNPADYHSKKIAFIEMIDSHPISLGRDKSNICEYSIRIDIFYYI